MFVFLYLNLYLFFELIGVHVHAGGGPPAPESPTWTKGRKQTTEATSE